MFAQHDLGQSAPYPTDLEAFVADVLVDVCEPAVIEFGGEPADQLPLRVAVWVPTEDQWAAGDRVALCVAQSALAELPTMIGTAAGGSLDSAEGIVARGTVDGQRDWFYSFEGSSLHRLTTGEFDLANTSPHAIDNSLLFAAPRQGADSQQARGYVFDSDTGAITDVLVDVPTAWEIAGLHLVAGGQAFVFAARTSPDDDWEIYRSAPSGGPVALTENEVDDRWPTVTPDGAQVVFHSDGDIWIMNGDGSDKRQLTDDPAQDYESAVSPDGTRIAFVSNRSGNDDVWLMNVDGSGQTNVTNHPAGEAWPFWSADGSVIYFQTDRLGANATIMMMETDGANQSYYSYELLTNGAVLPAAVSARYAAELPALE